MLTRLFDILFINQLFGTTERGETVFYPNGPVAQGYLVPADREPRVRSGIRWLMVVSLGGVFGLIWLVGALESWAGAELPLPWFIAGAVAGLVAAFVLIMRALKRLTVGLAPLSPPG
jgi:hypothetical protein